MAHKLPELNILINKHSNTNWKYFERYMIVNNKKIQDRLPLNKKLSTGNSTYTIGVVIEKVLDKIFFITYTLFNGVCVVNHESKHNLNGDILSLSINTFYDGMVHGVDDDGKMYLLELLEAFRADKFKWDIIE